MKRISTFAAMAVAISATVVAFTWRSSAADTQQGPPPNRQGQPGLTQPAPGEFGPGQGPRPMMQPGQMQGGQVTPVMLQDKDGRSLYVLLGNMLFRVDASTFKQTGTVRLTGPQDGFGPGGPGAQGPRGFRPGGAPTDGVPDKGK